MDNLIMFFKIIDNLYLGDEETSKNLEQLKSLNITHILRIGTGLDIIKFPVKRGFILEFYLYGCRFNRF